MERNPMDYAQGDRPDASGLDRLAIAIHRLATVLESAAAAGLGVEHKPRYKAGPQSDSGLVDEAVMAARLGIKTRTLAKYRRQGKLPGCWIRNGRQIRWRTTETLQAWERGLP